MLLMTNTHDLKSYQNIAVNRITNYCDNKGILLMHGVGSGKTLTSLTTALNSLELIHKTDNSPNIIVIVHPTGLYSQFHNEIVTKLPGISECTEQEKKQQAKHEEKLQAKFKLNTKDESVNFYNFSFFDNERREVSNWAFDKREGEGKITFSNGDTCEGVWKDDKRDGKHKYVKADTNEIFYLHFTNGKITGTYQDENSTTIINTFGQLGITPWSLLKGLKGGKKTTRKHKGGKKSKKYGKNKKHGRTKDKRTNKKTRKLQK